MITTKQFHDRKEWYLNDKLHRENGPAVEYNNGGKYWYLHGQRHRIEGPAIEGSCGTKEWYLHGKLHRIDGPACEWNNGNKYWYLHGLHHRIDGPACEWSNGTKIWYIHGQRHRIDGPARVWNDGTKNWYLHDKHLSLPEIQAHQISRLQDLTLSLSPLELPPYVIFWILEWSESAYIAELDQRSVIKMIEGIRNSRQKLKNNVG